MTCVGDPKLIPRLRDYMVDSPYRHLSPGRINFMLVANDLMSSYSEYKRKKLHPFKVSVENAWRMICDAETSAKVKSKAEGGWAGDDGPISYVDDGSGSDSGEVKEDVAVYEDTNAVNSMMQGLYSQTAKKKICSQSAPTSPMTPRIPEEEEDEAPNTGPKKLIKSATKKKLKKKDDKRESTHDSLAILKELKEGNQLSAKTKAISTPRKSGKNFRDIGGLENTIKEVCKLLVHLKHPEVLEKLGISPPKGVLLHGPPGCGKTLLANCMAGEMGLPMFSVSGPEIVSGVSGESEENIRNLFESAKAHAPCILFLDEVDVIAGDRESATKDMERRIVAQLLSCMDELNVVKQPENPKPDSTSTPVKEDEDDSMDVDKMPMSSTPSTKHILVIGATSRLQAVDPSLRRAGRFDREISLGIPDAGSREAILKIICGSTALEPTLNLASLAHDTPGYCGADLNALCREAAMIAVDRILKTHLSQNKFDSDFKVHECHGKETNMLQWFLKQPPISSTALTDAYISRADFDAALKLVQPSAKREGFATVPDVTWDDIGALKDVRDELAISVLAPIRYPEEFERLGLTQPPGILLAGPPGCGKTLLAKAIANESGLNFISVKGPELLNMYVGESERAIRTVFERARNSAPSVIFFDEIDSLCPKRSTSSSDSSARVVNQLLTEMDGLETKGRHVFVIGATNRPDILDPAVLRPGRLDKTLFVGFPSAEERSEILTAITRGGTRPPLGSDVVLPSIAADDCCEGLTGADLAALVREAAVAALRDAMGTRDLSRKRDYNGSTVQSALPNTPSNSPSTLTTVCLRHFEIAFSKLKPSVSKKDRAIYEEIRTKALDLVKRA